MFSPLKNRSTAWEWMDMPDITDDELAEGFDVIEKMERVCGGYRVILNYLKQCSRDWPETKPLSILDLYCGRGGLSREIMAWASQSKFRLHILAVDRFGRIIDMAKDTGVHSRIQFAVHDWPDRIFLNAQQFDYVVSSLSLHHQSDERVVPFIKTLHRLARKGMIITDWIRDPRALLWMKAFCRFTDAAAVQEDGPLSIKKGFTIKELRKYREEAGLEHIQIKKHFGYRFSLSTTHALAFNKKPVPIIPVAST